MQVDLSTTIRKRAFYPIFDETLMTYNIADGALFVGFPMAVWNEDEEGKTFLDDLLLKSEILKDVSYPSQNNLYIEAYINVNEKNQVKVRLGIYEGSENQQTELYSQNVSLTEAEETELFSRIESFLGREVLNSIFENSRWLYKVLLIFMEETSNVTESE